MHLDVLDLRSFYYRSALGRAAQKVVRDALVTLWPEAKGLTVAGYGFAAPLLRPFLNEARRVIALMPGPQGVMPWPAGHANVSVLCEETLWPLATGFVDRLVVMHGIETSDHPDALLDECWRVLGPGGRAVFVLTNRAGLWSRTDATPFGYGRPYTLGQFEALLKRHRFTTERSMSALYQPPSTHRFWRRSAGILESAGRHLPLLAAGGVLIVEVSKQVTLPSRGLSATDRPRRVMEALPLPAARIASEWSAAGSSETRGRSRARGG